jgi:hypothetical protein
MNRLTLFQISGYVNHLSEIRQSENGTLFRSVLIGRGEKESSYNLTLFGTQARLADFELTKGTKVKFTKVRLVPTNTATYKEKNIANSFSLVAEDWITVDEWTKDVVEPVVSNASSFNGFVNHVAEETSASGTPSVSVLIGRGQNRPSVGFKNFGKQSEFVTMQKKQFVSVTKMGLNPVRDEALKEKNIATNFYVSVLGYDVYNKDDEGKSTAESHGYKAQGSVNNGQNQSRQQKANTNNNPPVDRNEDAYADSFANRQTETAGGIDDDDIPF